MSAPRDDRIDERPVTIWLHKSQHRKLKRLSVELDITMKKIVSAAIDNEIDRLSRPSSGHE